MSEQIEQIGQTAAPEEDLLLPEGWTEGEDIFAGEAAGGGEDGDALPPREEPTETAPITGESTAASPKLRFTARVDHEDRQVELDESELPALYQKAQATERAQRRLRELSELREADAARDLGAEAEELLRVFPDMQGRSIPTEVVLESLRGKRSLTAAFAAWNERQHREALEALRRENGRRLAGRRAAERAPVHGVSGGGSADTRPGDPFLAGFDSDNW